MTPATTALDAAGIRYVLHQYRHDPSIQHFGEEAAQQLGVDRQQVFKTLVFSVESNRFGVAVIPVSQNLNLKEAARCVHARKAQMAAPKDVPRITGYVLGGVSPIGQKRQLPTVIDVSAKAQASIYVSAGKRGLEIELAPQDLLRLTGGCYELLGVSK